MSELPTGTVSLLFSDIEGSTALLKRLGPAYAEALDGQRRVLRKAWADHGGTELGTEGDSFYVVFPTAEAAVAAATQGQRDLADFEWPGGEQVRVRMGIHTGSPALHDGAYVGMDVHRAARIAGAAHGGQVLLSSATSELVTGCLPEQVTVKDLGSHQLKDITAPEHLFQLTIEGLQTAFASLKTLGAASSLPRPATPLVGRDGELAELTALLSSPQVRLVTLTGPGGSGKTRLAIALAERLVDRFPDGMYFVPLASVMTGDVMWTSIAEVLDVPPEGRIPPGFFDHVAHRAALFVLDNLEQIDGADMVVAELLEHGPQVVVVASSRRPLNLPAERQHAVPPLELPEQPTLEEARRSGAVQMFVQRAQAVKASFALTSANAAEVVELCRRLDGLPLAIELTAARSKLLTPAALLARLDKALDLSATSSLASARQKTLRDTIAWSYNLLNRIQRAFFRRLGVFAGGADLEAITAITRDIPDDSDPLDLIADLVDASLVKIADDAGEPRIEMLETIRAFALDRLHDAEEAADVHLTHLKHFMTLAQQMSARTSGTGERLVEARNDFEREEANFREALGWALADQNVSAEARRLGVSLCVELVNFWRDAGSFNEGQQWLDAAIRLADPESRGLGHCLNALTDVLIPQGHYQNALETATTSVALWRRLEDPAGLSRALLTLGSLSRSNQSDAVRAHEEALALARQTGDAVLLSEALVALARTEGLGGNLERCLELGNSAITIARRLGDELGDLELCHMRAVLLRFMGRLTDAHLEMNALIPPLLRLADPTFRVVVAEDYAAVLAELGDHTATARLLGAADAARSRKRTPRGPSQQTEISEPLNKARAALGPSLWQAEYERGRSMTVENALTEAHAATADMAG